MKWGLWGSYFHMTENESIRPGSAEGLHDRHSGSKSTSPSRNFSTINVFPKYALALRGSYFHKIENWFICPDAAGYRKVVPLALRWSKSMSAHKNLREIDMFDEQVRMKPSGTPNRGNRATRAPRAIGNTQGWARATCNFPDFCEFA